MDTRFNAAYVISEKLSDNESLLWCGRPSSKSPVSPADIPRVIFGLLWCVITLFIFKGIFSAETKSFAILIGNVLPCLIFLSFGIFLIAGGYWQKSRLQKTAIYAITSKRVIFAKADINGNIKQMESIPIDRAEDGNLISGRNGVGTITFWSAATNQRYRNSNWVFYDIENCDRVWNILHKAKEMSADTDGGRNTHISR